jgi:A/G-specific adenine glycosylase
MPELTIIRQKLLKWYALNARALPWRGASDPYRIWVSEVMLQQTQVETVIPYYQHWLAKFPTLADLANANENEVLKVWEGLGYYSRARNLLKSAKIICDELNCEFPRDLSQLRKLPGVGDYIAGAVASIAFGQREAALDGNGKRVLARLYAYAKPVNLEKNAKELKQVLDDLLPEQQAGDFNQALMDLGSRICLPRRPKCGDCPLKSDCAANQQGLQLEIPVKTSRRPVPHYQVVAAVIREGDCVLIDKRPSNALLGGMWEFPGGKVEQGESLEQAIVREIREELGLEIIAGSEFGQYEHAYTHFSVTVHAILCDILRGEVKALEADEIAWVSLNNLDDYPMGKVDRQISIDLNASCRKTLK